MICDLKDGICKSNDKSNDKNNDLSKEILYFTDPICSICWAVEPILRKLCLEFDIKLNYKMGGLLPNWESMKGKISSPKDVAIHWEEASAYFEMPIDGDIWLEDPLNSSYPPSMAYLVAKEIDSLKAEKFLRILKQMLFLDKINISKYENIEKAVKICDIDISKFSQIYKKDGENLLKQDLQFTQKSNIRGFPTLVFGKTHLIGYKSYEEYEKALLNFMPNLNKVSYLKDLNFIFKVYETLSLKEICTLLEIDKYQAKTLINSANLKEKISKNGSIYSLK